MDASGILARQLVIGEVLARQARRIPDRIALVDGDLRYTYLELNRRVNKLASALARKGVARGDKVALLMFNCSQMVECYFALAKLGVVAVPVNFRLAGQEMVYILNHSQSRMLVFDGLYNRTIKEIRDRIPGVEDLVTLDKDPEEGFIGYEDLLSEGSEEEPMVPVYDDDDAYIMYTSGTTGRPKGAVLTHKNKMMCCFNGIIEIGLKPTDVYICVPPIFHTAALFAVLMHVLLGVKIVLVKIFNPADVAETIAREGGTVIFLVPAMWQMILQVPGAAEKLAGLRIGITGAAIMPLPLKQYVSKTLPNMGLYDALGQTEMSPVTTVLKAEDFLRKPDSVGRPVFNVEIRVVDDAGNDVPVGEVGEITYRGPTMMKEYYRDPSATAEAIVDGWFHSGDLVRLDDEGFVYVVDRKKDMVITGGENVYPAEVEEVLYRHEKVQEAAVIGVPDEKWGERVHAVVVPKPGESLTAEEIIEWCSGRLAGYKKPRSVEFTDALPRNAAGKVLKTRLRELYS